MNKKEPMGTGLVIELRRVNALLARYAHQRRMLAMLAMYGGRFAKESQLIEALAIRACVLRYECDKNEDGTWIYFPPPEETK